MSHNKVRTAKERGFIKVQRLTLTLALSQRRGNNGSVSLLPREKGIAQWAFKKGDEGKRWLQVLQII